MIYYDRIVVLEGIDVNKTSKSKEWCLSLSASFRCRYVNCHHAMHIPENIAAWKVSRYRGFSDLYFPVFGLNTEIKGVNLRIQSECRKIRTRNNSVFRHFSHSVSYIHVNTWNPFCLLFCFYSTHIIFFFSDYFVDIPAYLV